MRFPGAIPMALASICKLRAPKPPSWILRFERDGSRAHARPRPATHGRPQVGPRAMPCAELPGFVRALQQRKEVAARALEFAILTAARSGEVLGATWENEINLDEGVWTIPAARMKNAEAFRVPLSKMAVALLKELPREEGNSFVFIGARPGKLLGKEALQMTLARLGRDDVTVHGFRSTFRDWAGERTAFPFEVLEKALAHTIGNKSSRAYARSDLLAERRKLMSKWADFCHSPSVERGADVMPMRATRP
jgi:integrase